MSGIVADFFAKFTAFIEKIRATYAANFITIFGCVQELKLFELKCAFFK